MPETESATTTKPDAIIAVERWNHHWGNRDLEGMKRVAADDFIQWHATVRKNLTKDEEFDMLVEALKVMQIQFRDIHLTPMTNDTVLMQCVGDIEIANAGARSGVPFAMVFNTRGQQITRCDEYMDGMSLPPIDFTPKD
ncbi:Ketosteroid isomerase-like protein [Novosphingobium lubricantis]|jgi:ketosteroid isomerase-like protein